MAEEVQYVDFELDDDVTKNNDQQGASNIG